MDAVTRALHDVLAWSPILDPDIRIPENAMMLRHPSGHVVLVVQEESHWEIYQRSGRGRFLLSIPMTTYGPPLFLFDLDHSMGPVAQARFQDLSDRIWAWVLNHFEVPIHAHLTLERERGLVRINAEPQDITLPRMFLARLDAIAHIPTYPHAEPGYLMSYDQACLWGPTSMHARLELIQSTSRL